MDKNIFVLDLLLCINPSVYTVDGCGSVKRKKPAWGLKICILGICLHLKSLFITNFIHIYPWVLINTCPAYSFIFSNSIWKCLWYFPAVLCILIRNNDAKWVYRVVINDHFSLLRGSHGGRGGGLTMWRHVKSIQSNTRMEIFFFFSSPFPDHPVGHHFGSQTHSGQALSAPLSGASFLVPPCVVAVWKTPGLGGTDTCPS